MVVVLGDHERVSPGSALDLFAHDPLRPGSLRRVAPGQPGDLCVLATPLAVARTALPDVDVAATVVRGEVIWSA